MRCEIVRTTSLGGTRLSLGIAITTRLARLASDFARFSLALSLKVRAGVTDQVMEMQSRTRHDN